VHHQPQAGRRDPDDNDAQVGPVLPEAHDQLPDAVQELSRAAGQRARLVLRVAIVDRDHRPAVAEPLQVDEVPERELEGMQPVDEGEVDPFAAEDG
jgi:hypothetical protein